MTTDKSRRIVLTGAAGNLGRVLAVGLAKRYDDIVLTDIVEFPDELPGNARFIKADFSNAEEIQAVCEAATAIVHFGGINTEKSIETLLSANFLGIANIFEAARINRARVIVASSNHAVGFYERSRVLTIQDAARPDSFYGISKLFGENVGSLYFDKHGVESVHLRIGSALPEPTDTRHLSTWLSPSDMLAMVETAIEAERTDFAIVWGVSANTRSWWGDDDSERLGIRRADNAEIYAGQVAAATSDPVVEQYQGGSICRIDYTRPAE